MLIIRTDILGISFDNICLDTAVDMAMDFINRGEKCRVVTPNAEFGLDSMKNEKLRVILNQSELVLPDGIGVVYASRIIGTPIGSRVAGVEFGEKLIDKMQNTGKSLFLYGGKPEVADLAASRLKEKYPGVLIAGTQNGYIQDEASLIKQINDSGADVLYVCLGCPRQEYFMERNREKLNVTLMAGLGGSIDIFSGNTKRAPKFFTKFGLEWFYRLINEPARIKRMIRLPLYLVHAFRSKGKRRDNNA